jgi:hypothetical protein
LPRTQTWSASQTIPHPPQSRGLVSICTHDWPQATLPVGQAPAVQTPPAHREPDAQAFPHVPQFAPSVAVSTQAPVQFVSPGRQAQAPEIHALVAPQTFPHVLQSTGLDWKLGQTLPHAVPAQVHTPLVQRPPLQVAPHAPQLLGSVEGSTQVPEQLMWPAVQVQVPVRQVALAPQAFPHPPQLPESLLRLAQTDPHWVVPTGQAHTPETHEAPEGQAVPQLPQWLALVAKSTQAPLQSVRGAEQVAGPPPPPPPQPVRGTRDRTRNAPRTAMEALRCWIMLASPWVRGS